jgi:ACS family hexuronate transporter-like MFS transporter
LGIPDSDVIDPPPPPLERRIAWLVAITAMLTMTVSYVDRSTLAVLAPTVTKALDISDTGYGWLTASFSIAYLVSTPVAGWWLDRTGARRGLVRSVLAWSAVAALHAVVPGFGVLFALRIALGTAEGPGFPGAAQTVHRVLPQADQSRGFGMLFMGSSIGMMIAPPMATLLFRHGGWRLAFVGTALVGLLWVPLWIALTRRPDVRARMDHVPPTAALRPRAGLREVLVHPIMVRALIAIFAIAPAMSFPLTWGAKYLVATFHIPQGDVGGFLWLPPLLLDGGALLFGDLAARIPRAPHAPPRLLFVFAMVLGASIALMPLASTPWKSIAVVCATVAGGGAIYTLVTADMLSRMPAETVSVASGVIACAQSAALIIANPLIGAALDRWHDYDAVAIALGLWVIPGSLVWLAWRPAPRFTSTDTIATAVVRA